MDQNGPPYRAVINSELSALTVRSSVRTLDFCLTPTCPRRATGGYRVPRRWEGRGGGNQGGGSGGGGGGGALPMTTPTRLELFCIKTGSDESHGNVSLNVWDK